MSLSRIIHHSHSFTRLEIYHHIYFMNHNEITELKCGGREEAEGFIIAEFAQSMTQSCYLSVSLRVNPVPSRFIFRMGLRGRFGMPTVKIPNERKPIAIKLSLSSYLFAIQIEIPGHGLWYYSRAEMHSLL